MGLALGFAVQVDAEIDRFGAACKPLLAPGIKRCEGSRRPCNGRRRARRRPRGFWLWLARRGRRLRIRRQRLPPQWRDRAGDIAPELLLVCAQPRRDGLPSPALMIAAAI